MDLSCNILGVDISLEVSTDGVGCDHDYYKFDKEDYGPQEWTVYKCIKCYDIISVEEAVRRSIH